MTRGKGDKDWMLRSKREEKSTEDYALSSHDMFNDSSDVFRLNKIRLD